MLFMFQDSTIDNAVKLIPVLRHLHIHCVHVVTSEFHRPRAKVYFDSILGRDFKIQYHDANDDLTPDQRRDKTKTEKLRLEQSREALQKASAVQHDGQI